MNVDEAQLVEQAKSEPTSFELLYERHVDRIYNYIFHRVGSVEDAEDLTARTFHQALARIDTFVDRGAPVSAWLYRIAHNLIANWHRDRSRRNELSLDATAPRAEIGLIGDGLAARIIAAQKVREALLQLEPDRQALLVLKFSEGLSNAEIGAVLGRSEGAVKSLYHRTLLALREHLGDLHVSTEGHEEALNARRN